jgi:RNA polymerase sigma-70 factor, ECF subfamily
MAAQREEITRLLQQWSSGNDQALHELIPLLHKELRKMAKAYLAREWDAKSWQPTQLLNEAYLRLVNCQQVTWQDRAHFFRLAAKKMREILVDYARKKRLKKMGGGNVRIVPIEEATQIQSKGTDTVDLIVLDAALEQLEALDPRKSEIVEMRFFAGLTVDEIAETLGVAVSTVHRDLHLAKVWLFRAIHDGKIDES